MSHCTIYCIYCINMDGASWISSNEVWAKQIEQMRWINTVLLRGALLSKLQPLRKTSDIQLSEDIDSDKWENGDSSSLYPPFLSTNEPVQSYVMRRTVVKWDRTAPPARDTSPLLTSSFLHSSFVAQASIHAGFLKQYSIWTVYEA